MVSLKWLERPYVKDWLAENPSVQKWLDNSVGYVEKFCRLSMRREIDIIVTAMIRFTWEKSSGGGIRF